jgi:hypothetical protein
MFSPPSPFRPTIQLSYIMKKRTSPNNVKLAQAIALENLSIAHTNKKLTGIISLQIAPIKKKQPPKKLFLKFV